MSRTGSTIRHPAWPIAISALLCLVLYRSIDLSQLRGFVLRIDWTRLPELVLCLAAIVATTSVRWRLLVGCRLGWRQALSTTAIGLAGNQMLPARGGDLLRAFLTSRRASVSYHLTLSALLVEKIIDLAAVAIIGLVALGFLVHIHGMNALRSAAIATAATAAAASLSALALARTSRLPRILRGLARFLRLRPKGYRHVFRFFLHLRRGTDHRALPGPFLLTLFVWIVPCCLFFIVAAECVGVALALPEAQLLVFAAALGLALPAAPSGVGTLHAAIVSGFVLLGRSAAEGLLVAVAVHIVSAAGFLCGGVLAFVFDARALYLVRRSEAIR